MQVKEELAYWPAVHASQLDAPTTETLPAAHGVQLDAAVLEYVPAAHSSQLVSSAALFLSLAKWQGEAVKVMTLQLCTLTPDPCHEKQRPILLLHCHEDTMALLG